MKVSLDETQEPSKRRKRYVRESGEAVKALTVGKQRLLLSVAAYGMISLPQLALLTGQSPKSVRRHMRALFDAGWVNIIAVPRAALAEPEEINDASLLFGSAPNIYALSPFGAKYLFQQGLLTEIPSLSSYGPKNSLFLAHELEIRDVRIWLERTARAQADHEIMRWAEGAEAMFELGQNKAPRVVRPDAWFVYRIQQKVLVGLVEVDRGTERGGTRWQQKLNAYKALFEGEHLRKTTGYVNARVLVIVPNARRRDTLVEFLQKHAPPLLTERFWVAERSVLQEASFLWPGWRQGARQELGAFLAAREQPK